MNKKKLNILWTNADPQTSELMVLMYAKNVIPKKWWDEAEVIIWGKTAKLVAQDKRIQELVAEAQESGVKFTACQSCADKLCIKQELEKLGIELKFMGQPLTDIIQNGEKLLTV